MIPRREFLQDLGALTCGAALTGCGRGRAASPATLQTINLIFHGAFAFIVDSSIQAIRVVTPVNHDHAFCSYDGNTYTKMIDLPTDNNYNLDSTSLNVGMMPKPDKYRSIVISGAECGGFKSSDAGKPQPGADPQIAVLLTLPFPGPPRFLSEALRTTRPTYISVVHMAARLWQLNTLWCMYSITP